MPDTKTSLDSQNKSTNGTNVNYHEINYSYNKRCLAWEKSNICSPFSSSETKHDSSPLRQHQYPHTRSSPLSSVSFYKYAFFTLSVSGGRKRAITEARQIMTKAAVRGIQLQKIELIRWIVIPRIAGNHRLELKCAHTDLSLILADRRINNYFFSCEYNIPLPFPLHPHTDKCSAIICLWHQATAHTEAKHTLWANSQKWWQKSNF